MPRSFRRFLVFQAFLLWQGGFVFYSGVVVPVGTDILGGPNQGLVTQKVTNWLNLIGVAWHLLFAWDVFAEADPSRLRKRWRIGLWVASAALMAGLFALHPYLDSQFVENAIPKANWRAFRVAHITYLWVSTGQWLIGLALVWLTIGVWTARRGDSHGTIQSG
jgi:hypothetical protein